MTQISSTRKHEQLTARLRRELEKKEFPGGRFYTVKYLMEHYRVSQATLTRVMAPLFETGELYSVAGKGTFVRKRVPGPETSAIGMVFCVVSSGEVFHREYNPNTWFTLQEIFAGAAACTGTRGDALNLITVPVDGPEFRHLAKLPRAGFIFLEYDRFESQIEYCMKHSIPLAVFAKHSKLSRKINQVWLDTEQAQYDAVSHLIARGHREIAFVGDRKNSTRHRGYCAAMRDAGLVCRQDYALFNAEGTEETAYEMTMRLIAEHPELTAVACSTDIRAVGVLKAVQDSGKRTPQFAVTGIDDVSRIYCDVPENLTSVRLPFRELGEALANMIYSGEKNLCVRMAPSLIVRQTS